MAGSVSVYLLAGMQIKLTVPDYPELGDSWFSRTASLKIDETTEQTFTNGFYVEDDNVGEITAVQSEAAVIYKHKRAEKNRIWWYAATGEKCVIIVDSVPIHDHSSIVQGGPAYGTYFSDDTT